MPLKNAFRNVFKWHFWILLAGASSGGLFGVPSGGLKGIEGNLVQWHSYIMLPVCLVKRNSPMAFHHL